MTPDLPARVREALDGELAKCAGSYDACCEEHQDAALAAVIAVVQEDTAERIGAWLRHIDRLDEIPERWPGRGRQASTMGRRWPVSLPEKPHERSRHSTPVPSDEAVLAAEKLERAWSTHGGYYPGARAYLAAAYAVDAPRLRAEAAAEARADYDDFIEGLTAKLNAAGVPAMPSWPDAIDWLIERAQSAQAEARAATLREATEWLAWLDDEFTRLSEDGTEYSIASAFSAHFNPEANPDDT